MRSVTRVRRSPGRSLGLLAALVMAACQDQPTNPTPAGSGLDGPSLMVVGSPNMFTQVNAGIAHTCARRGDGVVECWGDNSSGQAPAIRTAASGTFTEVGAGAYYSCGLRSDGLAECWGANADGQAPPIRSPASGAFTQLSAGSGYTCALRGDGVAECWGINTYGQAPATKNAASGVFTQVSAGTSATCARRADGLVECWGFTGSGGQAPPIKTATTGTFVQVSVGTDHTCALRDDGVVECWGPNSQGQAPATKTAASGSFTQVSAGSFYTCALRQDGVVECWGDPSPFDFGQAPATKSAAVGTFAAIAAGELHTCAVRTDGIVECWGYNAQGQAPATKTASGSTTVHLLPTAAFSATPASTLVGQPFILGLSSAQVPGYAGSVSFSYAFDCGDGAGYGSFGPSSTASCGTSSIGTLSVKGTVRDQDGDQTEYTGSVAVIYAFGGFLGPVDAPPVLNLAKAGAAVPAKFSLGSNQGLAILAAGYPKSQPIGCDAASPSDPIEETVTDGSSGLSYDAASGLYTYVWKTDKAWAATCRLLTLALVDGTEHTALFKFSR